MARATLNTIRWDIADLIWGDDPEPGKTYTTKDEAEKAAAEWNRPNDHPGRYRARPVKVRTTGRGSS